MCGVVRGVDQGHSISPEGYELAGTQASWHRCPPSPAGPASVPCSTGRRTETAWGETGGKDISVGLRRHNNSCSPTSHIKQETYFSISGAQCTKSWLQNLKAGFLISSMKVMRRPHGWGLFTISLSNRTLNNEEETLTKIRRRRSTTSSGPRSGLTWWSAPGWPRCWPRQTDRASCSWSSECDCWGNAADWRSHSRTGNALEKENQKPDETFHLLKVRCSTPNNPAASALPRSKDIRYVGEKSFKHSWLVVSKYLWKDLNLMLLAYPQCPGPQPDSGRCPCEQSGWWCSWRGCCPYCGCERLPASPHTTLEHWSAGCCSGFLVH